MGQATDGAPPTIWFTRVMSNTDEVLDIQPHMEGGAEAIVRYKSRTGRFRQTRDDPYPPCLVLEDKEMAIPPSSRDAFRVIGGLLVVSEKVRDVFERSDLGTSHLVEVPIYTTPAQEERIEGRFFLLHVSEFKDCFVPEGSEEVWNDLHRPHVLSGHYGKKTKYDIWMPFGSSDVLVVRASAAEGVAIWAHPNLRTRFFISDPLKQALDAARIKTKVLKFVRATVVP